MELVFYPLICFLYVYIEVSAHDAAVRAIQPNAGATAVMDGHGRDASHFLVFRGEHPIRALGWHGISWGARFCNCVFHVIHRIWNSKRVLSAHSGLIYPGEVRRRTGIEVLAPERLPSMATLLPPRQDASCATLRAHEVMSLAGLVSRLPGVGWCCHGGVYPPKCSRTRANMAGCINSPCGVRKQAGELLSTRTAAQRRRRLAIGCRRNSQDT